MPASPPRCHMKKTTDPILGGKEREKASAQVMDIYGLSRRELQALCKKNHLPANKSNADMASALHELYAAGALEFNEALPSFSPKKAEAMAASHPGRTPARRAAMLPSVGSSEKPMSPRRRTLLINASSYPRPVTGGKCDDEKAATSKATPVPPSAPSVSNLQESATRRIARRSACKKEDDCDDGGLAEPSKTPATRNARRSAVGKGVSEPLAVVEEKKDMVAPLEVFSCRKGKSTADALRASASRAAAMMMKTLAEEEAHAKKVQEGIETKHSPRRNLVAEHNSVVEAKTSDVASDRKTLVQERRVKKADVSNRLPSNLRFTIVDGTDDQYPRTETFQEHCSAQIEKLILWRQQTIGNKEHGRDQEAARLNADCSSHGGKEAGQVEDVLQSGLEEKSSHGGKELNQMEDLLSGLQGSPVIGLVSSSEKPEPAKDDMIEQKLKVEASGEDEVVGSEDIKGGK